MRPSSTYRRTLRRRILQEQGHVCFWCQCELVYESAQLDRVWSGRFGGTYCYDNLVASCDACNKRRGAECKAQKKGDARREIAPIIKALRAQRGVAA